MTATVLNNLGEAAVRQQRLDEAEPLLRKALMIRQEVLGADHPSTGNSLNNVAGLLMSKGEKAEAASMFKQSLEITRLVRHFQPG
jgi:Tfp pilus assembly protein PilF